MAERRMFHIRIVGSDAFLSMPPTAQLLYFHLGMRADEDGFINNSLPITRAVGLKQRDLQILLERRFLLQVDGVLVIKHWKLANTLKNDRLRGLQYPDAAKKLYIRANGIYTDHPVEDGQNLLDYKRECIAKKTAARNRRIAEYGEQRGETCPESEKPPAGIRVDSKKEPPGTHLDTAWNPSRALEVEPSRTEPSRTEPNRAEPSSHAAAAAEQKAGDSTAATAAAGEMRLLQGELGKGVVLLTDAQIEDLLNRMGLEAFDQYVDKLANFIVKKQARVKNHYATLLQWWQEDRKVV